MEQNNKQSQSPNTQAPAQNASQPLEQLTEEQISVLMERLEKLKQQKAESQKEAQSVQTTENNPKVSHAPAHASGNDAQIFPDPACFAELDSDADDEEAENSSIHAEDDPLQTTRIFQSSDLLITDDAASANKETVPNPPDDLSYHAESPYDDDNAIEDDETIAVYKERIQKKRKQRKLYIILGVCVFVLILIIVSFAAFLKYYKPALNPNPPSFITGNDSDPLTVQTKDTDSSGNKKDPNEQVPQINDTYARREDVYNFLVLGIDRAANLSDVIMIVSYDVKNDDIHVLSLPRDTYINVGSNYHKLNAYFSASYNHSASKGEARYKDAIKSMADFLEQGLCIRLDRYVCVDTEGFREIIDAVNGVDMDVPFDMDYEDPEQDLYIHLKAGYQHLDGAQAEQFVRYRSGYINGDIGRISAQKLFLTALVNQVKNNFNVSTVVSVAKAALQYVTTDLSAADIGYFAKYALGVDMSKITFTTMPGEGVINPDTGASYYVMYAENMRQIVNTQFNVYTREITRDVFLSNAKHFTSTESYISSVFTTEISDPEILSAEEIEQNTITLPLK